MPIFFLHTPELCRIIMTASSATARLLSLAVLILSLAPLGSIYVLLFSFGINGGGGGSSIRAGSDAIDGIRSSGGSESAVPGGPMAGQSSLAHVLSDPNATVEELWTALFLDRWNPVEGGDYDNPFVLAYLPMNAKSAHHLHMVLPWALSLIVGVVVPACLSIWSFMQNRDRIAAMRRGEVGDDEEELGDDRLDASERKREKRMRKVRRILSLFTTTLTDTDRDVVRSPSSSYCAEAPTQAREDMEDAHCGAWRLPLAGVPLVTCDEGDETIGYESESEVDWDDAPGTLRPSSDVDPTTRSVAGTCAICLNQYQAGDTVCWSPNPYCVHAFHEKCILSWLFRKGCKRQHLVCPCCRQNFVSPQTSRTSSNRR